MQAKRAHRRKPGMQQLRHALLAPFLDSSGIPLIDSDALATRQPISN
jgi:hypothetical protein